MNHSNQVGTVEERIAALNRQRAIEQRVLALETAAREVYQDCIRNFWAPSDSAMETLRKDLQKFGRWAAFLERALDGEMPVPSPESALIEAAEAAIDYLNDGPADPDAARRGLVSQLTVALAQARGEGSP